MSGTTMAVGAERRAGEAVPTRCAALGLIGLAGASALAGAANGIGMLAGARALQGVFAALLAPTTLSLLAVMFTDARERAKAFAVFGAIAGSGGAVGLVLGGTLAEYLDWRWCLYVNIPVAVIAAAGGYAFLPDPPGRGRQRL